MKLSYLNKTVNDIHKHVSSMMKVSQRYGKKMGRMGTLPFNSAEGSTFARKTAEMMATNSGSVDDMLGSIFKKATSAGMSEEHMSRMNTVADRIRGSFSGPRKELDSLSYL
jgi:hypothetical protein